MAGKIWDQSEPAPIFTPHLFAQFWVLSAGSTFALPELPAEFGRKIRGRKIFNPQPAESSRNICHPLDDKPAGPRKNMALTG